MLNFPFGRMPKAAGCACAADGKNTIIFLSLKNDKSEKCALFLCKQKYGDFADLQMKKKSMKVQDKKSAKLHPSKFNAPLPAAGTRADTISNKHCSKDVFAE